MTSGCTAAELTTEWLLLKYTLSLLEVFLSFRLLSATEMHPVLFL